MSVNSFNRNQQVSTRILESAALSSTGTERPSPATAGSPGFEAVMARLTPAVRAAVVEKIQTVDPARVEELVNALEAAELSAPIFRDPNLTLYAHAALFNGQITNLQFATVQRFSMALERRGGGEAKYEVHHLFDESGAPNPATMEMLRKTWSDNSASQEIAELAQAAEAMKGTDAERQAKAVELQKNQCDLSADQEARFSALVQELPPSERQVILMDDLELGQVRYASALFSGQLPEGQTISQAVNQETGVNVFCRLDHGGSPKRMIASTGIMQAYLTASDRTMRINPVVGLSDRSDIHAGLVEGYHDMGIAGLPEITEALPERADGYVAKGEDFPWHDFYHSIRQGNIPADHMEMHLALADAMLKEIKKDPAVERLYESIIDAEYPAYLPGIAEIQDPALGTPPNLLFWSTLQMTIAKSTTTQAVKDGNMDLADQYIEEFAEGPACRLVAQAILDNSEAWAAHGVTQEGFFRIADEAQKQVNKLLKNLTGVDSRRFWLLPPGDQMILREIKTKLERGTGILPVVEQLKGLLNKGKL